MHDIRFIRENPAAFDAGLARRGLSPMSGQILELDAQLRAATTAKQEGETLRNAASKAIGAAIGGTAGAGGGLLDGGGHRGDVAELATGPGVLAVEVHGDVGRSGAQVGRVVARVADDVHHRRRGHDEVGGIGAACARDDHGIAGSVPLDAVADGGDDARGIRPDASRLGDGRRRAQPRPQLQVEGVHPDRLDAEGDLARTGRGHLDVDRGEDLRPSEFGVRDGGAHGGAHTTSRAISPARRRPS